MVTVTQVTQRNINKDLKITLTYEGAKGEERIHESVDYRGITTTYYYNSDGSINYLSKSNNTTIHYTGSKGNERIEYVIDKNGNRSDYEYLNDVLKRVITTTSTLLFLSETTYTGAEGRERIATVRNRKDVVTTYNYNTEGKLIGTS